MSRRLPQLDGLRAVAVACVMAFHFIPGVDRYAPLGSIGVRLFFVLSGFLITRILLEPSTRTGSAAWSQRLRVFYIRRGLRIFPLFYLVLLLAALINIGPVRATLGWHVSYLTNFYLFDRGAWHGSISHLWSLAVEEQFYLVWPLLTLLVPERKLPAVMVVMVVAAPISRLLIGGPMNSVLPLSCTDSLGAGALLALPSMRSRMMRAGLVVGLPLMLAALALRGLGYTSVPYEVALDFGVSLSGAWLIGRAADGFGGASGAFLTLAPIAYLGTISYGLYLYHGFMPYVLGRYVEGFVDMAWPVRALLLSMATVITASVSWWVFESPILRYKDRLSDGQRLPSPDVVEAA